MTISSIVGYVFMIHHIAHVHQPMTDAERESFVFPDDLRSPYTTSPRGQYHVERQLPILQSFLCI